jgi:tRNA(Ile)-lysidine synthase
VIHRLQKYITQNQLFEQKDKLLVAVSGGVDSMVLCDLLAKLNYQISIAHCNFQLRGEESEEDELFVENYAKKLGINFHKKRFDTEGYAHVHKVGTQEAARNLRYEWFAELTQLFDYQCVITAHHATDNIETVLFNFSHGAGLRGLKGMLPKTNNIVRPFLWALKKDISQFAGIENIAYREDSSNETDKYARNFIRHTILPAFKNLNPNFENTATENIEKLREANDLLQFFIKKAKLEVIQHIDNQILIDKNKIKAYPSVLTLLFDVLRDYGFNSHQVEDILSENNHKTKTGTKYYSADFELVIDRDFYIIQKKEQNIECNETPITFGTEGVTTEETLINEKDNVVNIHHASLVMRHDFAPNFMMEKKENQAQFDFDALTFPLKIRRWKEGDVFQPLGMKGKKQKLSDYFSHNKFSDFDKRKTWIIETANQEICWIVGHRMDERFKLKNETTHCISITYTL